MHSSGILKLSFSCSSRTKIAIRRTSNVPGHEMNDDFEIVDSVCSEMKYCFHII